MKISGPAVPTQRRGTMSGESYGIVIDAGSSGSRVHVFRWSTAPYGDSTSKAQEENNELTEQILSSPPEIVQEDGWSHKVSPGLSSFESKPKSSYKKHVKPLVEFAKRVIPKEQWKDTPVLLQATAGMRLLPTTARNAIMRDVCQGLKSDGEFLMKNCEQQIEVIDGAAEGLYGWLGVNYLYGHFNEKSNHDGRTLGFMDMGGASTQIAFSPADQMQHEKHADDMTTVYLRNMDGKEQKWEVFVSTWLGFGANQARERYLAQLVHAVPEVIDPKSNKRPSISDPCLPLGAKTLFTHEGREFHIQGVGNYEQCSKSIYPLLLKHLPCYDEPCLFNGVHAPQIDFNHDKFIGTAEYWYTANDVFHLGGKYEYQTFSEHVKAFCNLGWKEIQDNSEKGMYHAISKSNLLNACFKANWVLSVLHEGFQLPRIGIDASNDNMDYPMFQSVERVNDRELSWTLGRILLYACSAIPAVDKASKVGIQPSHNEVTRHGKGFVSGDLESANLGRGLMGSLWLMFLIFMVLCGFAIWHRGTRFVILDKIRKHLGETATWTQKLNQLEEGLFIAADGSAFDSSRGNATGELYNDGLSFVNGSKRGSARNLTKTDSQGPKPSYHVSARAMPTDLRTTFSLSDFGKYKDERFSD